MTEHPLTDKILTQFGMPLDEYMGQFAMPAHLFVGEEEDRIFFEKDMRDCADWQLERVMRWLDRYLTSFGGSDEYYRGKCESIFDLKDHLKKAMRPTTTTTQEDS